MTPDRIGTRLVLHIGGYDPMSPADAHRRFGRELARFDRTWSTRSEVGPVVVDADLATWPVSSTGQNWHVRTEIRLLRWDDVMAAAQQESRHRRVVRGIAAFADFIAGGALLGYLRFAWRYALFFLFPFGLLAGCLAAAFLSGVVASRTIGSTWAALLVGVVVGAGLVGLAFRRLPLDHLLDDWIFARAYLRRPDPVLGPRLDRVAAGIATAHRAGDFDEIVVLGHSLGAVLAVDLVDRLLRLDPDVARREMVVLVTVGSSIPKIGLHRAATRLREALRRVATSGLFWVEYQALTDAMNFYKTDPVAACGAGPRGPILRTIRISRMLDRAYYRTIKRNFFRVHNQFVSANDHPAAYDYLMLLCGPVSAREQATAALGSATRIGPADGALATSAEAGETILSQETSA